MGVTKRLCIYLLYLKKQKLEKSKKFLKLFFKLKNEKSKNWNCQKLRSAIWYHPVKFCKNFSKIERRTAKKLSIFGVFWRKLHFLQNCLVNPGKTIYENDELDEVHLMVAKKIVLHQYFLKKMQKTQKNVLFSHGSYTITTK